MARSETFISLPPEELFRELAGSRHGRIESSLPPVRLRRSRRIAAVLPTRATYELQPHEEGTRVSVVEDLALPLGSLVMGPVGHGLLRLRNAQALRRLKLGIETGQPGMGG